MPRAKKGREPRLLHPEERQLHLLSAYYDVLGLDPGFDADLRRLYGKLAILARQTFAEEVERFCEKWRLPQGSGPEDVITSCLVPDLREDGLKFPLRMQPGLRVTSWPTPEMLATRLPDAAPPDQQSRQWLSAYESLARAHVVDELKARNIVPLPPRHRDYQVLIRMAWRLYRRAVQELPWERIAEFERDDSNPDYPDSESVRTTVNNWAKWLGVPLPTRDGGRPKKPVTLGTFP